MPKSLSVFICWYFRLSCAHKPEPHNKSYFYFTYLYLIHFIFSLHDTGIHSILALCFNYLFLYLSIYLVKYLLIHSYTHPSSRPCIYLCFFSFSLSLSYSQSTAEILGRDHHQNYIPLPSVRGFQPEYNKTLQTRRREIKKTNNSIYYN